MQRYWQRHAPHAYATDPIFDLIADERGRENPESILPRVNTPEAQYAKLAVLMEEVARAALGLCPKHQAEILGAQRAPPWFRHTQWYDQHHDPGAKGPAHPADGVRRHRRNTHPAG